jgi:hypothetical protein
MGDSLTRSLPNPYCWDNESTQRFVSRSALLEEALLVCNGGERQVEGQPLETFQGGGVFLLLGTRGMGKSSFLAKLEHDFKKANVAGIVVLHFPTTPIPKFHPQLSAPDVVATLTDKLIESTRLPGSSDYTALRKKLEDLGRKDRLLELFDTYLNEFAGTVERIVLMYDELDAYAAPSSVGNNYFNPLEDARKKLDQRLAIVAAGGLGMLTLRTVLGSPMFTRASRKVLEPFDSAEIEDLAAPFRERGTPLSPDVLTTLLHLSGGNLALTTYGLEKLWGIENPSPRDLVFMFERFRDDSHDFLTSIRQAVFGFDRSEIPYHVWTRLRASSAGLPKADLLTIRRELQVENKIADKDILDMLRAAGLIRMDSNAWKADPIVAQIIPSILMFDALPKASARTASLQEQLRHDLTEIMAYIHQTTPAYYRPGTKKNSSQMVPELNFSAVLLTNLLSRGWKGDLEPISGGGYADIKARYPSRWGEQVAIVEVKRWTGAAYVAGIHNQIKRYVTQGVDALATVVIGDVQDSSWKDTYKSSCLDGKADGHAEWKPLDRPLEGYFEARWESRVIEHFLLRLAARE